MRTYLPFIRKLRQGKIKGFDGKYLRQAAGSVLIAAIATLILLPRSAAEGPVYDIPSGLSVFATAFAFGFGSNTLINELLKWQEAEYE